MNLSIQQLDEEIEEAATVIKKGGVCVIPTETAYGLAASIHFENALKRIYLIKKRPYNKPLLLLIRKLEEAPLDFSLIPAYAYGLMKTFWPGPLTLLLPAKRGIHYFLAGHTNKVGIRMSSNPVAMELVKRVGGAITATSANLSGLELTKTIDQVKEQLKEGPDYFLDAGSIAPGPPSTIVDCSGQAPLIVRAGAIPPEDILAVD